MESTNTRSYKDMDFREQVRSRSAMFVGSRDSFGLHSLFAAVFDNAVNEHLAGHTKEIEVVAYNDGSFSVWYDDDGKMAHLDVDTGLSFAEIAVTNVRPSDQVAATYKVSGGMHGTALSIVNFLSERYFSEIVSSRDRLEIIFEQGLKKSVSRAAVEDGQRFGTKIVVKPDKEIFVNSTLDVSGIRRLLVTASYLNPGLKVNFSDETSSPPQSTTYQSPEGITEYLRSIETLLGVGYSAGLAVHTTVENVQIDVALSNNRSYNSLLLSYANNTRTFEGGTHVDGFLLGLTRALNDHYLDGRIEDPMTFCSKAFKGLTAILSVNLIEPIFDGPTRERLASTEVGPIVESVVYSALLDYLKDNPRATGHWWLLEYNFLDKCRGS